MTRRSATAERLLAAMGGSPTRTGGGGGWENHRKRSNERRRQLRPSDAARCVSLCPRWSRQTAGNANNSDV